jgi:hypothetical protein
MGRQDREVTEPLADLVDVLDLESIEVNIFRGVSPADKRQRVFGGQVAGQALVAAGRTLTDDGPPSTREPCTRCTPTFSGPAIRVCPSSTRWTGSVTADRSAPAALWPSNTAGPFSICRRRFIATKRA